MQAFRTLRWITAVVHRRFVVKNRATARTTTRTTLSIVGIASGVTVLVTVLSVMNGFQIDAINDILEIGSYHLRLSGLSATATSDEIETVLLSLPGVRAATPFREYQVLVGSSRKTPRGAVIRAVPVDLLARDRDLAERIEILEGAFRLGGGSNGEVDVVIGVELALRLNVGLGDSIDYFGLEGRDTRPPMRVVGLFRTGYLEYDSTLIFMPLASAEMATWGIKLDNRFDDVEYRRRITQLAVDAGWRTDDLEIISWRDYNRAIFGALRLEKVSLILMLGLIFLVVAINIFQYLRRNIFAQRDEIAVLKAIGAAPSHIRILYALEGLIIGMVGGTLGVALGFALSANINNIFTLAEKIVNLLLGVINALFGIGDLESFTLLSPDIFYITNIPIAVVPGEIVGIYLFSSLLCLVAAWLATRRLASMRPSEVLRFGLA